MEDVTSVETEGCSYVFTPHAQRERGKVIGRGVHIYYIFNIGRRICGGRPASIHALLIAVIGRAKRAPHWGVQSRFRVIYVYMCVCRGPKSVGGNTWAKRAHAQSQYWAVKSDQ